jgi:hypothetical protein
MSHKYLKVEKFKENQLSIREKKLCWQKISELDLKRKIRSDAVLMVGITVSLDENLLKKITLKDREKFYRDCVDFFNERYGEYNYIQCKSRVKEVFRPNPSDPERREHRYPYMQYQFVPITEGRLSAGALIKRGELIKLHEDFDREIGSKWGLKRLKDEMVELEKLRQENANLRQENANITSQIEESDSKLNSELKNTQILLSQAQIRIKDIEWVLEQDLGLKYEELSNIGGERLCLKFLVQMLPVEFKKNLDSNMKNMLRKLRIVDLK